MTTTDLIHEAARVFEADEALILSRRRPRPVADARNAAMVIYYEQHERKADVVAEAFSRHRTAIYHAVCKVRALCGSDPTFSARYNQLRTRAAEL